MPSGNRAPGNKPMKNIERIRTPHATVNRRLHIKSLLARYHAVSDTAKQDMLSFMMTAPSLETVLFACNKKVSGRLLSWKSKLQKRLGFGFANHMSLLLILICLGCFLLCYMIEAFFEAAFELNILFATAKSSCVSISVHLRPVISSA